MKNLCPFFKETCHGNQCIMWKNEECLIASFLQRISEGPEESMPSSEESLLESRRGMILDREEAEVPDWIKNRTPEECAVEIFEFTKKEQTEVGLDYDSASRHFWESKGVQEFLMPSEVQSKMQRADFLARRRALQEEKDELPSLVGKCVDWARFNNLNKVALADVDAFLMEKDLHLLRETKRALHLMANLKLKTGK